MSDRGVRSGCQIGVSDQDVRSGYQIRMSDKWIVCLSCRQDRSGFFKNHEWVSHSVTIICQRQRDRQQCSKTIIGWPCCWRTVSACSCLLLFSGWFQWQLKGKAAAVANGQLQLLCCEHDLIQQLSIHAANWLRLQERHQRVKTNQNPPLLRTRGWGRLYFNPSYPFQSVLVRIKDMTAYQRVLLKLDTIHATSHQSIGFGVKVQSVVFWASRRRQLPLTKLGNEMIWTNQKLPLIIHMLWPGWPHSFSLCSRPMRKDCCFGSDSQERLREMYPSCRLLAMSLLRCFSNIIQSIRKFHLHGCSAHLDICKEIPCKKYFS